MKYRKRLTILFLLNAVLLVLFMMKNQYYGSGSDIWGHLFKSNLMYEGIKEGQIFPLYSKYWYNGIQPFRYWAPFPYYLMALLQAVCLGSVIGSYYLFAGVSYFFGAYGFILWGKATNRMKLCGAFGLLWFFLPENVRVFYCEGNLPRMVTTILIPYLIYFIYCYVRKNEKKAMYGIIIFMALMTLSHVMIAAMMGIGTFLFLLIDGMSHKEYRRQANTIIGMLLSIFLCGIWLIPSLVGGLVGMDTGASESVMRSLTYPILQSLDYTNRIDGITDTFYYGLSIVVISAIGIILSKSKKKAGYILTFLILLCTTPQMVIVLSKLPLSQLLWMMRFATIGYGFFFLSFVEWSNLKRSFCVILLAFLVIDCIPSMNLKRYFTPTHEHLNEEYEMLNELTVQRTAILDLSMFGSYPSYDLCTVGKTPYTYGWAWQGAATAQNIVLLNTALEQESYDYVFDRILELGNDTVLVKSDLVGKKGKTENDLITAAERVGYQMIKKTDHAYLFKREVPGSFGVITQYEGIGIGTYAGQISFLYPVFTTGESNYIDEYSVEELSEYKTIYLSGFLYHDKDKAEELIKIVSKKGVRIVIDMGHVPVNKQTNRYTFLGVTAQDIKFEGTYPEMTYKNESIHAVSFDEEYKEWNTVYIQGIDQVMGTADFLGNELPFAGQKEDNIYFVGFNLLYHYSLTKDAGMISVMNDLFKMTNNKLPKREIIPLEIQYGKRSITITSQKDMINSTIAYQDNFKSVNEINDKDNLLYIRKGTTVITYGYPYLKAGIITSLLAAFFIWILIKRIKNV